MNETFTDRFKKVMQLANMEAHLYNHKHIATEHVLLGLIKEGNGVAVNVLNNLDINLGQIQVEIEKRIQADQKPSLTGTLPRSPEADRVIEYAMEEARSLKHNFFGTEHLLLGLLREGEGIAAKVLGNIGLRAEQVREEVLHLLGRSL